MVHWLFTKAMLSALCLLSAESVGHSQQLPGAPAPTMPALRTPRETVYVDAHAARCPKVKHSWPVDWTVYHSCTNHGLDGAICAVNEIVTWCFSVMFVVGLGMILRAKWLLDNIEAGKVKAGYNALPPEQLYHIDQTHAPRFDSIYPGHHEETGKFILSHLGHLIAKDNEMRNSQALVSAKHYYWKTFSRIVGLWNLAVPAISIVLQGLLKVSGNDHQAGEGNYKDTGAINYKDYDLNECARSFRQCSVAVYTIVAIILQGLLKVYTPNENAGICEEQLAALSARQKDFQQNLLAAGAVKGEQHDSKE